MKTTKPLVELIRALPDGDYAFSSKNVSKVLPSGERLPVSGPLKLVAHVKTLNSNQVLVKLKLMDVVGNSCSILVAPSEFNYPARLMDKLADCGWPVYDKAATQKLLADLYRLHPPKRTIWQTTAPGWQKVISDQPFLYAANNQTFKSAKNSSDLVLAAGVDAGFSSAGDVDAWNQNIGCLCVRNPWLQFGVSLSFASLLLRFSGLPNFGFLIVGNSKSGKTITMKVAASIFGSNSYVQNWNATVNALDLMARTRTDGLLILDELAEGDAKAVSEAAYRLMNGASKQRMGADGELAGGLPFVGLVLASGELDLRQHLKQSGIEVKPGQLARLISIPTPEQVGVFATLHGHATGPELGATFAHATSKDFGTLAPAFLQYLVENQVSLQKIIPAKVRKVANCLLGFLDEIPDQGTYDSVAQSFALVAIAGELAIANELLAWEKSDAKKAIKKCFLAWAKHEQQNKPFSEQEFVSYLQQFFATEADGKFLPFSHFDPKNESGLAGYRHVVDGAPAFLVFPNYFEDVLCPHVGKAVAIRILLQCNVLVVGARDTPTKQLTIPKARQFGGQTKASFYVIREKVIRL